MNTAMSGRFWRACDRLLIALVCLEPRLMAAYQGTLGEIAADGRAHERPAALDIDVSISDARDAAAGAVA